MSGITLLGLGPGPAAQLTREAWDVLSMASEIWLRTRQHPSVDAFPAGLVVHSFDDLGDDSVIVERVLELGQLDSGVIYAVPGHPFIGDAYCPEIVRAAATRGIPVRVVEGISHLEPVFSALGLSPFPRLTLLDGLELSRQNIATFPPDVPVLITYLNRRVAESVQRVLNTVYPIGYPVRLVYFSGTTWVVQELSLDALSASEYAGALAMLYIPLMKVGTSFEAFQEVIAHLRAPDGCPWDREQTHLSLRKHLLEESYETLAAMDEEDPEKMREEFGDLLLQVVLNAQIAAEAGEFTMADVLSGIHDKIIRRHPHVFGEVQVDGVGQVLSNWESIKKEERKNRGEEEKGLLDGLPAALPALNQAQEFQARAARVGFDWPEIDGVLDKVREEIVEIQQAKNPDELMDELGDLFFVLVNLARWKEIDAEAALRAANLKFKKRFGYVEKRAREQGRAMKEMSLQELDDLWNEAKRSL